MKNGGGSKADEAMQGETTGNPEAENVLKRAMMMFLQCPFHPIPLN